MYIFYVFQMSLLLYVIMNVPLGLVETSFQSGLLRVGDDVRYVPGYELSSVRKNNGLLYFKFVPTEWAPLSPSF